MTMITITNIMNPQLQIINVDPHLKCLSPNNDVINPFLLLIYYQKALRVAKFLANILLIHAATREISPPHGGTPLRD